MPTKPKRTPRRSDALSKERIVVAAIEILDADGERALTFRALAAHLSTGAGAIYWHVTDKDELLAEATNAVVSQVMPQVNEHQDPREEIRSIALGLFDAIEAHPWIGAQLPRETWQLAITQIFEGIGARLDALGVPEESQFDVASALTNYVSGVAGQNAANARNAPPGMDRATFLSRTASRWEQLDPAAFPFIHRVVAQLPGHDDHKQFVAGIDLILAGAERLS